MTTGETSRRRYKSQRPLNTYAKELYGNQTEGVCLLVRLSMTIFPFPGWLSTGVGVIIRIIIRVSGDLNPTTARHSTAYQAPNLTSKILIHKHINKRIHSGIT